MWTGPRSAPLVAVGGAIVDGVPEPLKAFAIRPFGVCYKIALLTGTAILLTLFFRTPPMSQAEVGGATKSGLRPWRWLRQNHRARRFNDQTYPEMSD